MTLPTILVVDDEPLNLMLFEEYLADLPCVVECCQSGEEALARLQAAGPAIDLLLLDLMMPGMGGYALLATLRASRHFDGLAIVMASARGERSEIERCRAAGANDYLVKPVAGEDLIAAVHRQLRREIVAG